MTIETYEEYFRNIVAQYAKLTSFWAIDMFEFKDFEANLRQGKVKTPALVLEHYANSTTGQLNNVHDSLDCAFVILDRFDIKNLTISEFLVNTERMAKEVRLKMLQDSEKNCAALSGLVLESIHIVKTETIGGSFMGYRISFQIVQVDETVLTAEDWA